MSKYSVEEVREMSKAMGIASAVSFHPDFEKTPNHRVWSGDASKMLKNYAERIEADEGAMPVASLHADGYWAWNGTPPHESNYAGWRMDVFTHPPAQAAQ